MKRSIVYISTLFLLGCGSVSGNSYSNNLTPYNSLIDRVNSLVENSVNKRFRQEYKENGYNKIIFGSNVGGIETRVLRIERELSEGRKLVVVNNFNNSSKSKKNCVVIAREVRGENRDIRLECEVKDDKVKLIRQYGSRNLSTIEDENKFMQEFGDDVKEVIRTQNNSYGIMTIFDTAYGSRG